MYSAAVSLIPREFSVCCKWIDGQPAGCHLRPSNGGHYEFQCQENFNLAKSLFMRLLPTYLERTHQSQ
jgi:hypothetical protein